MGSFSRVFLSFDFREETPEDVLAAFSRLARPHPQDAWWGPAPTLPNPVAEAQEGWEPDWREGGMPDEFEHEPWRHDWALWLSGAMDVGTTPSASLAWTELKRWNLTSRCSFKSWPEAIHRFLAWLGPYIEGFEDVERARLVGLIEDDAAPRPALLWVQGGELLLEDLNRAT